LLWAGCAAGALVIASCGGGRAGSAVRDRPAAVPVPRTVNRDPLPATARREALAQIAPLTEARISRETGGLLTTVHFYSRALHKEADYMVFLPRGYRPTQRLPVFYLLHGMPGRPLAFTVDAQIELRYERLVRERLLAPMILVFPDGRIDGRVKSDSEWANTRSGNFESYVVDVMHDVDQRFAARDCRQERAIAGLSAGAYGAANVGLHRDSLFGLIQVWSGYFTETHNGVFAHASRAVMAHNSPIDFVRSMRGTLRRFPLRIFLYAGTDERGRRQLPGMVYALRSEGAHVGWALYPGGHSWNTWAPHVEQMLIMASHDFAHPLGGRPVKCQRAGVAPATRT
jgi:enterochelin esterase-like enzyme